MMKISSFRISGKWLTILLFTLWITKISCRHSKTTKQEQTALPSGWEGNTQYFRLEDGEIVAGNLQDAIPNNEFLCTDKVYRNFEMKLKAKLTGDGQNAGIQFRSERIPNHFEVIGYQCDMGRMADRFIWGSLYDESRRREFLVHPPAGAVEKVLKENDWNEFVIRAEGPRIQIWLNGIQTVDYTELDDSVAEEGIICLQIHSGPPAEARYKDLAIREL